MNKNENHVKENWLSPKIEIKESPGKEKGMFAVEKIAEGEEVIIWGEGYTDARGAEESKAKGNFFMQWDDNLFSVEGYGNGLDYCINHSCDSNTWMKDAYTLIAKRDIDVGEEVMADYALWEADENYISTWNCKCSSSICRKRVTGKDWRLTELQERYKNHFSPIINKKVAELRVKNLPAAAPIFE